MNSIFLTAANRPKASPVKTLAKWGIFGVLASLVPFLVAFLKASSQLEALAFEQILRAVLGRGELLLVVVALCSASCGEIFSWSGRAPTASLIIGGASVLIALLATSYYGELSSMYSSSPTKVDVVKVLRYSTYLFVAALISSGCAVVLTRER